MSVTEQMLIHAQEFNTRIDQVETLNVERYNEVMNILVDILDRLEVLEIRLKEMN